MIGPDSQWRSGPDQARRRHDHDDAMAWRQRSDAIANKIFRSGDDRRQYRAARQDAGPGAGAARRDRAQMSSALSDREIAGTPVTAGAATGFDVDLAGLQSGNSVTLDYQVHAGRRGRSVHLRPRRLRRRPAACRHRPAAMPNNTVVGIDFSGGAGLGGDARSRRRSAPASPSPIDRLDAAHPR